MFYKKNSTTSYIFIVIATALLYLWQLHLYPMINPDGVTYIEAAAAFVKGGLQAALALNEQARWPFYPVMIAEVHNITHFTVYTSERLLDGTLICLMSCIFLYVVRLFSEHRYASLWAIVVWLTWHSYAKWWPVVMRDNGFLMFLLLSFCCYYRFVLTRKFLWALAWSVSMLLAELFRIEAMIYLLIVPFSIFFLTQSTKSYRFVLWLRLNVVTLIVAAGVTMLFVTKVLTLDSLRFAYMWQEFSLYFITTWHEFSQRYVAVHRYIFYRENPYAVYGLIMGYGAIFICYVIGQVSFAALPPLFFMRRVLSKLNKQMLQPAFWVYIGLSWIIPMFFFIEYVFLNGRYLLPLGLFVLLFVASILPHVIDSFAGKRKKFFIALMTALFLVNFVGSLFPFGHRTHDELDVGLWLKENYPQKTVFTDTKRILFYDSDAPDYRNGEVLERLLHGTLESAETWLSEQTSWCQYDLLALSAPLRKTAEEYGLFEHLQHRGMIGPILKSFIRQSNGEVILVAPILHPGCAEFAHESEKKS